MGVGVEVVLEFLVAILLKTSCAGDTISKVMRFINDDKLGGFEGDFVLVFGILCFIIA